MTRTDPETGDILVLNSGSSSLKFGLFSVAADDEAPLLEGSADGIGRAGGSLQMKSRDSNVDVQMSPVMESQTDALQKLASVLDEHGYGRPVAVGHRVVHGGPNVRTHRRLTAEVKRQLQEAVHFAPLHIPPALTLIDEASAIFGNAQHFVCFDTAFHCTLPPRAAHLPLPRRYADAGVIRYGFHGLSYESLVHRLGADLPARTVFAHLGNGSSLCALRDGKSVDTSMGLTPTGGIPMGTRSGDLDPGVLLYLMRVEGLDADGLETLLNRASGLAGFAGGESDMQALLRRSADGDSDAALAVEVFATAVRKSIGAYAALLGGIDLLVFTGGIGEHSPEIRDRICMELDFLGLSPGHHVAKVRVMHTEEERQIARHCRALLESPAN
ncbi:acetate/propionate family kinase [Paraburkholderia sp. GAS348]|uniref:acetate/propionate family kinase n=1 Tax=Paraburkholderia sp. GAS348 TaxID=3035132 RepID=UPI003D1B6B14